MNRPLSPERSPCPSITCIVPALNEYENLALLLPALSELLQTLAERWEIIVVDDGSTDATPVLMAGFAAEPGFRYLRLSRNFGKEAALTAGLAASGGEVTVLLDADFQHPLELISRMLDRWREGVDTVYAVRRSRSDEHWIKRWGSALFYRMLEQRQGVVVPADAGDFRLLDRRVVDALLSLPERTRFMKGLYAWVGFTSEAMPYMPAERRHGESKFNFLRLVGFAFDGISAFSTWPLRALSVLGFLLAMMAFVYGGYLTIKYFLIGNPVSGWTTIVAALMFFSGINLIALGVIGTYVGRIFDEAKRRPLYLIREERGARKE